MTTPKCGGCPFRRDCQDCPWSGENPTAAPVSDARTGAASGRLGQVPRTRETAPAGNRGLTTQTSEESKWL